MRYAVDDVTHNLMRPDVKELAAPAYTGNSSEPKFGLAVESMKLHMTDEGWQVFAGLEHAGYKLFGRRNTTDVKQILEGNPGTLLLQDKREYEGQTAGAGFDRSERYFNVELLKARTDVFKLTILKDSQSNPQYHRGSAEEIGCHAWIVYYHPRIVKHLAPYVRSRHLIRTYHTIDKDQVPPFEQNRRHSALLSGALGRAYPLRTALSQRLRAVPGAVLMRHPGYRRDKCWTPEYLQALAKFKVAVCTCSMYGYALRKIIEATACGCIVVTDLPEDEVLPEIDGNLVRVHPQQNIASVIEVIRNAAKSYDPARQRGFAEAAKTRYDYRVECSRLASEIEVARRNYSQEAPQEVIRMTEQEALTRMIAPGTRRPGKYRQGVIQIHVTRACDKACFGCTQGSNLAGKVPMISPELFEQAVISLKGYYGVVGVFGGNPAMHPQFDVLCGILRKHIPLEQRGLWSNHPKGWGKAMAATFYPPVCNLNVHLDREAYDEFKRDWPASQPFGLHEDSRHSPPYAAMKDVISDEGQIWEKISNCDINKHWSAMIGVFRGELRAWFCEIAGAQAMLHQDEPDYPDTGLQVDGDWWKRSMADFAPQVRKHCFDCGVPLRGYGELAMSTDGIEQVTKTHESVYRPKRKDRNVQVVIELTQLGVGKLRLMTDYLGNAKR